MSMNANQTETTILDEIEAEFAELESDFGDLGLEDDDDPASSEMQEFEATLSGTEFASENAEADMGDALTILQIADGQLPSGGEEGFFGSVLDVVKNPIKKIIKRKAKKIIKHLMSLVRRFAKYRACLPAITLAIAAYKTGKYGTAVKRGYAAYKCIRAHS